MRLQPIVRNGVAWYYGIQNGFVCVINADGPGRLSSSIPRDGMRLTRLQPSPDLRPFVRCYWIMNVDREDIPLRQTLFPFGSFELLFNMQNASSICVSVDHVNFDQPAVSICGQFTKSFELSFTDPTHTIGVSFFPWVAPIAFRDSGDVFTNRCTDGSLVRSDLCQIETLQAARTYEGIASALDTILRTSLLQSTVDPVAVDIVTMIHSAMSCQRIKEHLQGFGVSRRRIEQRFREATGLAISEYAKKVRFFRAVRSLADNSDNDLTMLGLDAGYYDQSHFIRHFKQFTGTTPTQFRSDQTPIKRFLSSLMP